MYFVVFDTEYNARWAYGPINDRAREIWDYLIKNCCRPEIFRIIIFDANTVYETVSLIEYVSRETI